MLCGFVVLVLTAWCILGLQTGDNFQLLRLAENMLNKQLHKANKGWSSSLGVGKGANNSLSKTGLL
jgi:hypothetical protein